MNISLKQVGKHFNQQAIFSDFTAQFTPDQIVGIKGQNGSGKSTLLQVISSILTADEGQLSYTTNQGQELPIEEARYNIGFVSPANQLLPHLTLQETVNFHFNMLPRHTKFNEHNFFETTWLTGHEQKIVNQCSSGMQQRLKLGLAFFTSNHYLLLDEPTSNLDSKGIEWVNKLIRNHRFGRGVIVASNEERDFIYCDTIIDIEQFK